MPWGARVLGVQPVFDHGVVAHHRQNRKWVAVVVRGDPTAGPASPVRDDVMELVKESIRSQYSGLPVVPMMAAYATDGKFTRAAAIPTYGVAALLFGPDDFRAHGLDERVSSRSFFKAGRYWRYLMMKL